MSADMCVGDFNFEAGMLLVHGKGKKDCTVPIPESIISEMKTQITVVEELHDWGFSWSGR